MTVLAGMAVGLGAKCSENGTPPSPMPPPKYAPLFDKTATAGTVRVIVTLRMAFTPEGALSESQAREQREKIAALQDRVLSRLKPHGVSAVYRSAFIPSLALTVDAEALRVLSQSEEVASIAEDAAVPPLNR